MSISLEEIQDKINLYRSKNQFSTVNLKFTNRYEREYEIECYRRLESNGANSSAIPKGSLYLRQSTAQCCICTPDIQNWQKNKSKDHQDRRLAEGSSIGTAVHKMVENLYGSRDLDPEGSLAIACKENEIDPTPELLEQVRQAFQGFLVLAKKTNLKFIASEVTVHSDQLDCAGTIDLIAEINGKIHIVDFKTGSVANGVKVESQISFYKLAFEEQLGIKAVATIFKLDRENGEKSFNWTYNNYDMNLRSFIGALSVFQVHEWKNLKTFWPKWNDSLFNVKHKEFPK